MIDIADDDIADDDIADGVLQNSTEHYRTFLPTVQIFFLIII